MVTINKAKKFKSDTSNPVKSMNNLICKGYDLASVVHSLRQVYFAKNIDNLLIPLECPIQLTIKSVNKFRISYMLFHITILYSLFDYNNLNLCN